MHLVHLKMMHLVDSTGIQCARGRLFLFFSPKPQMGLVQRLAAVMEPQMGLVQRLAAVMDTGCGSMTSCIKLPIRKWLLSSGEISQGKISAVSECLHVNQALGD